MASRTNGDSIVIIEESIARLDQHSQIPIVFEVTTLLEVSLLDTGLGGLSLREVPVEVPWTKNWDAIKGEGPTRWAKRFDVSTWGLLVAYVVDVRVGGAVIAFNTGGVHMLEGRPDQAVLWDLRVRPESRGTGIGSALFGAVETWARSRYCRTLKVETQNINVPACRFYRRMGCTLGAVDRFAYPDLPNEVQLVWFKEL